MSAKHTPGPWFTHRSGFSTVYVEAKIGGGMLQEVAACGPTAEGRYQQEANARMIAAAPELRDAAALALDWLESTGADGSPVQALRAAIAKATGEAACR